MDLLFEFVRDETLSEDHLMLLREIAAEFNAEDNAADLSIMYEVTGFQGETQDS